MEGFYLNASIGSVASGEMGDFQARMTFPLFLGGERQLQRKWVGNGTLPAGMGDQYTDDQLELLCVSEVTLPTPSFPKRYVPKAFFSKPSFPSTFFRSPMFPSPTLLPPQLTEFLQDVSLQLAVLPSFAQMRT